MTNLFHSMTVIAGALLMTACANTADHYNPIVDGPKDAKYEENLQECQQIATKRSYLNDDVLSDALLGSGIGALVGVAEDGASGAIGGALVGAVLTGGGRSWKTREERKKIVIECLQQRGFPALG